MSGGDIRADICVIGAGSGGLSVAAGAAQMGARVILVEGAEMGGDCLNHGCVPSKALLAAAAAAHARRTGEGFGVTGGPPLVDRGRVADHIAEVIAAIAPHDSQERFEGLGVQVIRAWARFTGPARVEAGGHTITARRFVIATGSTPFVPPVPGLQDVPILTNETIFALRETPAHLVVMGGGPIGLEMAQAHRRLGARVTVLEGARALGRDDPELAAHVLAALRAEGVDIREGAQASHVSGREGDIVVTTANGEEVRGSHLLVAVGRRANLGRLNLAAAGVAVENGHVKVDARLRSTNRRVLAVGDAAGPLQFTHLAGYHAGIVVRQAVLGLPAKARTDHVPHATYTAPELAQVGLTEAEARAQYGARLEVIRIDLGENDRARAQRAGGMVKVMAVGGRPVGAAIVGPHAGELIQIWALALSARLKLSAIAGMVAPYPTLGESAKRAAGAYFAPRLFENPWLRRLVRLVQRLP
ncbi:MAG: FAD-dependent oxidoreductase [Rhodobacteraceae bacterium]|nr:FAD-dependent oxidoreductase [Paracoccaceae bacterium]